MKFKCTFNVTVNGLCIDQLFNGTGYNPKLNGPIQFNMKDLILNPLSAVRDYGKFTITTLEMTDGELEIVDTVDIDNPFEIQAGKLN